MSEPTGYLRLRKQPGVSLTGGEEMMRWLWQDLSADDIGASLERIYDLGGYANRFAVESIREDRDGGFVGLNARDGLSSALKDIAADMKEMDRLDGGTLVEIKFDPAEWFKDGKQFYDFASGRLYWLAASGALSKLGFEVEGTGL